MSVKVKKNNLKNEILIKKICFVAGGLYDRTDLWGWLG